MRGEEEREVEVKQMDRVCLYELTLHLVRHVAVQQHLNGEGEERKGGGEKQKSARGCGV